MEDIPNEAEAFRLAGEMLRDAGITPDADFERRLARHFPALFAAFASIYGSYPDFARELGAAVLIAARSHAERPADLKDLDAAREAEPGWFLSNRMLGGVAYVDRYAGTLAGIARQIPYFKEIGLTYLHLMPLFLAPEANSDGGYAVSSYREVAPRLGTMAELAALTAELRHHGISPVIDFIFNHTSNEHEWARRALAGEPEYETYYWIFPDRSMPDAFEQTTREIFPDDHPGSFVALPGGRWIWSTFHSFQWDLNYSNPAVFRAMAGEMLFLANQGVEILRMDAVAFIWKRLGTPCESLAEAHLLIRAFNALCRIAAPALLFKSEAIVHPDEVASYIDPAECPISYNPLLMALSWEALATRDARLLQLGVDRRQALPPGCAFVNYVRSHDDIGWTFADEEAAELGVNGFDHRRFLNAFYVDRFPGSFARGLPFQDNPRTGDCRIAGTTASLAGIEAGEEGGVSRVLLLHAIALSAGGIPLLYLGDEVGQINDLSFRDRPGEAGDSRWVHRPFRSEALHAARHDVDTAAGRIYAGLARLIAARKETPALAGGAIHGFPTGNGQVLGYLRPEAGGLLVLANFADDPRGVAAARFEALPEAAEDVASGETLSLRADLILPPHGFVWLRLGRV